MRTLFIKIFLSFWLAMALTSIAYTVLALKTEIGQNSTLQRNIRPVLHSFTVRMGVSLVFGSVICYLLAWRLTRPVRRLRETAQRLAEGDLSVRVGLKPKRGGDEVADLAQDLDSMAERIESLIQSQKRLLRDISHELRSPLARLNVALGLARQHCSEAAEGYFDRTELEIERLDRLIGELMGLSLLESGIDTLKLKRLELAAVLERVARDAEFEAAGRGRGVTLTTREALTVEGDEDILVRALENIVRNGVRYTAEGTAVEIVLRRVAAEGGVYAAISVRDHGPGVPQEALDKLFLPFYRVTDGRKRPVGGFGVGLAITERAVKLHRGAVRAENAEGGGLLVEIFLPLEGC